jgi:hypothetical protein
LFFSAAPEERRLILTNLVASELKMPAVSPDVLARLEASALQRNASEFTRLLRAALAVAPQLAQRIVRDGSGEPLVVALKALGMAPAALQRILLFLDPAIGQSVGRVYQLSQLYDEMSPQAAAQMVAIWRAASPRHGIVHEPLTAADEARGAREAASPAARRVRETTTMTRRSDRKRV